MIFLPKLIFAFKDDARLGMAAELFELCMWGIDSCFYCKNLIV